MSNNNIIKDSLVKPEWSDTTLYDDQDGSIIGFTKTLVDTGTFTATLSTDYSVDKGRFLQLLCQRENGEWMDFASPDAAFELAQDLVEAASRWVELLHESDQGNAVAGEDL